MISPHFRRAYKSTKQGFCLNVRREFWNSMCVGDFAHSELPNHRRDPQVFGLSKWGKFSSFFCGVKKVGQTTGRCGGCGKVLQFFNFQSIFQPFLDSKLVYFKPLSLHSHCLRSIKYAFSLYNWHRLWDQSLMEIWARCTGFKYGWSH